MMVRVVMSRATLVPVTSFPLSTLVLHPTTYRGPLLAFTMTAQKHWVTSQARLQRSALRPHGGKWDLCSGHTSKAHPAGLHATNYV